MYQPATASQFNWMSQVQHFVIDQIVNGILRHAWAVKDTAYDNRVVCGIIMAKAAQRLAAAPGHLRSRHEAVEEAKIQVVKNLVKVVILAFGAFNVFASANLA